MLNNRNLGLYIVQKWSISNEHYIILVNRWPNEFESFKNSENKFHSGLPWANVDEKGRTGKGGMSTTEEIEETATPLKILLNLLCICKGKNIFFIINNIILINSKIYRHTCFCNLHYICNIYGVFLAPLMALCGRASR